MSMKVVSRYVQNFIVYSGDLNNDHLNNGNIWITNFHLSGIQMVGQYLDHHSNTGPVFKWWSEYRTKYILFKSAIYIDLFHLEG